jgi:hypothetical protein
MKLIIILIVIGMIGLVSASYSDNSIYGNLGIIKGTSSSSSCTCDTSNLVPYTGANNNITLGVFGLVSEYEEFDNYFHISSYMNKRTGNTNNDWIAGSFEVDDLNGNYKGCDFGSVWYGANCSGDFILNGQLLSSSNSSFNETRTNSLYYFKSNPNNYLNSTNLSNYNQNIITTQNITGHDGTFNGKVNINESLNVSTIYTNQSVNGIVYVNSSKALVTDKKTPFTYVNTRVSGGSDSGDITYTVGGFRFYTSYYHTTTDYQSIDCVGIACDINGINVIFDGNGNVVLDASAGDGTSYIPILNSDSITSNTGISYSGKVVCYTTTGELGHCTSVVGVTGGCTCVTN